MTLKTSSLTIAFQDNCEKYNTNMMKKKIFIFGIFWSIQIKHTKNCEHFMRWQIMFSSLCCQFVIVFCTCMSSFTLNTTQLYSQYMWGNFSSIYSSEKIKMKVLLGRVKDKRLCILASHSGIELLWLLACGRRLRFGHSSPVENTLLWGFQRCFDLSWCNFC